jgi:uncharacterized protein YukE
MAWTNENPGDGDLGQLSSAATDLGTKKSTTDTVSQNVQSADAAVNSDVWSGASTDAWRTRLQKGRTKVSDLATVFGAVSTAVGAYRESVAAIKSAAEPWRTQLWDAERRVNMHYIVSSDPSPEDLEQIQLQQNRAQRDLEEAQLELSRLAGEREEADSALVAAVNGALPGDWPAMYSALVAAGFTSMDAVGNTAAVEQMMAELAAEIAEGPVDPEDAAALTAMMQLYGEDETIMSRYFDGLGGDGTVELITALGDWGASDPAVAAAAVALAALTRSGLSVGSRNWSERTSEDFAEGMFSTGLYSGDEIGYLFSDSSDFPLGETLAVAAADLVDRYEREELQTWMELRSGGGSWLAVTELGIAGNRVNDASGPIFSTLGRYPDAAYQWLTAADGLGADRVQYWYNDRYDHMHWMDAGREQPPYIYYAHDKFQGISELFFGSQQATGGPWDPDDPNPVADPAGAAGLTATIMNALVGNDDFAPGNLNDEASAALAGAFALNLPALSEYPLSAEYPPGVDGPSWAYELPDGSILHIPVIDEQVLAEFLGVASSHPAGHDIVVSSVTMYQETLLNVAMASGSPQALEDALHRITDLQAAIVAADYGQQLEGAIASDENTEQIVSGVSLVVGALPIPGILGEGFEGFTKVALDFSQSVIVGGVTGEIWSGVGDAFATQTEQVLAEIEAGREGAFADIARVTLATSVYEYFAGVDAANAGTPGYVPVVDGIASPPNGTEDLYDWYLQNGGDLQESLGVYINGGDDSNPFPSNYFDTITNDYDDKIGSWIGYFRD